MIKLKDVVAFIRANDIDHEHWTDNELALGVNNCIQDNGFGYVTHPDGSLKGFYMGKWTDGETFEVAAIVGRGAFKELVQQFKRNFPQCSKVVGLRHVHEKGKVGKYSSNMKYKEYQLGKDF